MASVIKTIRNFYRDSVALMQLSSNLGKLSGVRQASAIMASEANLSLLREAGLLAGEVDAGPNDLLVALEGEDEAVLAAAAAEAEQTLRRKPASAVGERSLPRTAPKPGNGIGGDADGQPRAHLDLPGTPPRRKPQRRSASASM